MIGQSRQKIPTMQQAKATVTGKTGIKEESFPTAPKTDLPSVHTPTQSEPIAASS